MRNTTLFLSAAMVSSLLSWEVQANCTLTAVAGSTCPQAECLDPIACKGKSHRKCQKAVTNYFMHDAGAKAHQCMQLCSPATFDIVCKTNDTLPKASKKNH